MSSRSRMSSSFLPPLFCAAAVGVIFAGCGGGGTPANTEARAEAAPAEPALPDVPDAGDADDARRETGVALDGACASSFGDRLTEGFGRLDGVIYAVQRPSDTQCVMPNANHLVLQVVMRGAVYRMVVNVMGRSGAETSEVRFSAISHELPAPPWQDGWHAGVALDYVRTLGVTSASGFAPMPMVELVAAVRAELVVGARVSVYATSGAGRPESAHLVHRNKTNADGAIVVNPGTAPKFLLFHFEGQTF